jgi:thiaminase/transcriptional activator TenA
VRGIGTGEVNAEQFRRWVKQDYLFLVEYCRMLALGAARSPDLGTLRRFADLLQATAGSEMELHRSYAAEFGIGGDELESEAMAPVTRAYADFLVRTAATGDFAELAAALLPCMWGFNEVGLRLAERGRPEDPRLARWIDTYADPAFTSLANWCRELVDQLADGASAAERARMREAFLLSSQYELAFWDV